jgi:ABC-type branched-subunit amino acid transport system permease subunit
MAIKNHRVYTGGFTCSESVVTLIFVLAGGLGFLTALDAGALVVLLLSEVGQNAGLRAAALESLQSVVQRLVFLDVDFRHVFPSLQIRLAAL